MSPVNNYKIISFFTKNTGYEKEVTYLIASLEKFKLDFDIEGIENLGSWQKNTYYKAEFIKKKLDEHPDRNLIWLDADVILRQKPILFDSIKADFAVHYIEWKRPGRESRLELNTSVMYIANNMRARRLLDLWISENKKRIDSGIWEQRNLQNILIYYKDLDLFLLPATYCKISDLMAYIEDPVIELFQASRRFKMQVNQ